MNGKTSETVQVTGHYCPSDGTGDCFFREGTTFPPSPRGNSVRWYFSYSYRKH